MKKFLLYCGVVVALVFFEGSASADEELFPANAFYPGCMYDSGEHWITKNGGDNGWCVSCCNDVLGSYALVFENTVGTTEQSVKLRFRATQSENLSTIALNPTGAQAVYAAQQLAGSLTPSYTPGPADCTNTTNPNVWIPNGNGGFTCIFDKGTTCVPYQGAWAISEGSTPLPCAHQGWGGPSISNCGQCYSQMHSPL